MAFTFPSTCGIKQSFRGIEFRELVGSADFNYSDTPRTRRLYVVDWINAFDLAQALVGFTVRLNAKTQKWFVPHQDPDRDFLVATRVDGEGIGIVSQDQSNGAIAYDRAILTVDYEPLPEGGASGPNAGVSGNITFITERRTSAARAITLPKKKFQWFDGPRKGQSVGEDATLFRKVPQLQLTIDIHWWFDFPFDLSVEKLLGSVNKKSIEILLTKYPKGTLRFDHVNRVRQFTSTGVEASQVTLSLMWQPEEWNKKLEPDEGVFRFVQSAAGRRIHDEIDFAQLFPR